MLVAVGDPTIRDGHGARSGGTWCGETGAHWTMDRQDRLKTQA